MTAHAHHTRITRRGRAALIVVNALLLALTVASLLWAASEGEQLRCHRLIAAHNPAASTYCEGMR